MKGFNRQDHSLSLCGLNCLLCPMHLRGYCPGCGKGDGNQSCVIAKCSIKHENIEYCFLCSDYLCSHYHEIDNYDSFITHQNQIVDNEKARLIGLDKYREEQKNKQVFLLELINEYNEGRKMTLYCQTVNLLPFDDLSTIMLELRSLTKKKQLNIKEKAEIAERLFKECARRNDINLKLRKKVSSSI